jgi:hypothetical protein
MREAVLLCWNCPRFRTMPCTAVPGETSKPITDTQTAIISLRKYVHTSNRADVKAHENLENLEGAGVLKV